ncbi:SLBB domain-containing protein [Azospirillum thermophilum]|nr:SLBB domain-containing protein [Azospirillum thermophilum]
MAPLLWAIAVRAAEPASPGPPAQPPFAAEHGISPLEAAFSARAGETLRLFGLELFGRPADPRQPPGGIQGDYVLNTGDELLVTLRGQKSFSKRFAVDSAGLLIVDEVAPVTAAGLPLSVLRGELAAAVSAALPNTETFVSLAEVRRIGVLVTGSVPRPGRHDLHAFATVLDALSAAGGVAPTGSLRRIRLIRAGTPGGGQPVDLYDLLLAGGGAADLRLRDGDRLFVPPLGAAVAVAGAVKRPAIYELPPDRPIQAVADLRMLAGGLLRPGAHRALRFGIGPAGEETVEEIADPDSPRFGDGDLLMLAPEREDRRNEVRLEGHVRRPGPRALAHARSLDALVGRPDLRPDAYLPFAVLSSPDGAGRGRRLQAVDLAAVLKGRDGRRLSEGDTLHVFGSEEVGYLTSEPVLDLLRGTRPPPPDACPGLLLLARTLDAAPDGPLAAGPQARAATGLTGGRQACPALFAQVPDLLPFALRHSVLMLTGVPRPGFYPRTGGAAGPDEEGAGPGAAIQEDKAPSYELVGHVRRPGIRPLVQGATLRSALGGEGEVKRDVYPLLGVIERFDRHSLTRSLIPFSPQEVRAGRSNRRLADGDRIHLFAASRIRDLLTPKDRVQEAEEAPDPAILALVTERRVQVRGAVLQPGAYPVADATPVEAVLAAAGGLSSDADPAAVEVTMADGVRSTLDLGRPAEARRTVGPGDALRVNPIAQALEPRSVAIEGAVRRPGSYDVGRGEVLSSLIARAGGLTEDAYPAGAVFTRESERRREKESFAQQARELERALTLELEKGEQVSSGNAALAHQLAAQLRGMEPLGRIVVEADPVVLRSRPELDVLLEAGDRIVIPKRPLTVAVAGEVQHPAAVQFISGKDASAYIAEAGGPTRNADTGRAYLVLPDGRAQPLSLSSWNHRVEVIPPGSVLVVPRDPKPFEFLDLSKTLGSIFSQLAITAASIAVITR